MATLIKRHLVNAIIAAVLVIGLAYLGVPSMLGAHPSWAIKVGYFGVVIGIVISSIVWVWRGGWMPKFGLFMFVTAITAGLVTLGKMRFVASFGEEVIAGRLWYFGWILLMGLAFSLVLHLLSLRD